MSSTTNVKICSHYKKQVTQKQKTVLLYNPAGPLLSICIRNEIYTSIQKIFACPCLLQHYTQKSRYGINQSVHHLRMDKENAVLYNGI